MSKNVRVVAYASVMMAAMAAAVPSRAEVTAADRYGTSMMVVVPSASAGASGPASVGSSTTAPVAIFDRSTPDRTVVIQPANLGGVPWLDVNHGDTVQFLVRAPNAPERTVKWRFNGMDNVMAYTDIDPQATFASNVKIYVNQTTNPLHANDGS